MALDFYKDRIIAKHADFRNVEVAHLMDILECWLSAQPECMRPSGIPDKLVHNYMRALFDNWSSDQPIGPMPQDMQLLFNERALPLGRLKEDIEGARTDAQRAGARMYCYPWLHEQVSPPVVKSV